MDDRRLLNLARSLILGTILSDEALRELYAALAQDHRYRGFPFEIELRPNYANAPQLRCTLTLEAGAIRWNIEATDTVAVPPAEPDAQLNDLLRALVLNHSPQLDLSRRQQAYEKLSQLGRPYIDANGEAWVADSTGRMIWRMKTVEVWYA